MDYEKNVCPYDVGQLLTAKKVLDWAIEQEDRVQNNIHNQTILGLMSEDEKIRKELITHCRNTRCVTEEGAERIAKWISWLKKQGEQKPAWNEEDKKMFVNIKACLRNANKDYSREVDWLKSLKGKVQPKQEWSEEDENMYRKLHNLIYAVPYCDSRKEFSDWLKSLKDRHTWKPSDEQMDNLSRAFNGATYQTSLLMELYQELNKLRSE